MLTTMTGQAFAATTAPDARGIDATGPSGQQAVYISKAVGSASAAETDGINAYRYHGGPKSND